MQSRKPPQGTQSVLRAIAVLKAVGSSDREVELQTLCDAVGLTRSTTHRLLAALESEGLVSRSVDANTYRLGPAAVALGARARRTSDLRTTVRPTLERLAEETGETATLEIPIDSGRMLILDEALGTHRVGVAPSVGTSWPMYATATGKALLARLSREMRERLQGPMEAFTDRTIVDQDRLAAELTLIQTRGFALNIEELEVGFVAAAAVVMDESGRAIASLSVGGPRLRINRRRLEKIGVRIAAEAREISASLGYEEERK